MKTHHTPTPWTHSGVGDRCTIYRATDTSVYGIATIETDQSHKNCLGSGTAAANAAFIVMACNAHDELLEVADWVVSARAQGHPINDALYNKAKAAIAKAKGE